MFGTINYVETFSTFLVMFAIIDKISRWLSADVFYVLRKFFGVILLAMAIKLFSNNILAIVHQMP